MADKNLNSLKLSALRAQEIAEANTKKSLLVSTAVKIRRFQKKLRTNAAIVCRSLFSKKELYADRLRILVHVRGGIGDVVMSRFLVKKLREKMPDAEISLCHDSRSVVEMVFSDGLIDRFQDRKYVPQHFDLAMSGCHFIMFDHYDMERIKSLAPDYLPCLRKALDIQKYFRTFEEYSPDMDGQFAEIMVSHGYSRVSSLGLFTGLEISQNDRADIALDKQKMQQILSKFGLEGKKYITLHSGINIHTAVKGSLTRNWPEKCWEEFVRMFRDSFPDYLTVQIGGGTSMPFDFADISLVNKTELKDLPYLITGAELHIDGETGMAHLANVTKTDSVVLYGPSRAEYLSYSRNINISAEKCGGCMNIDRYWMSKCVLGFPKEQQCLGTIKPETVFNAVQKYLRRTEI